MEKQHKDDKLADKLKEYKRKYYLNLVIKGSIISVAIIAGLFVLANYLEFSLRFGSVARGLILFLFIAATAFLVIKYVVNPFSKVINEKRGLSNEEAARNIGRFFPQISDRLLNLIQLRKSTDHNEALVAASIAQKSEDVLFVPFSEAIKYNENKKYLKYAAIPAIFILIILLWNPSVFSEGTERIVQFNKEFVPIAPFDFQLNNESMQAFKNEDFTLHLSLTGDAIPNTAYLAIGGRTIKMQRGTDGLFTYTFKKIQNPKQFNFEAAGFSSKSYDLEVINRPDLKNFNVVLDYPNYLNRNTERLSNVGNLVVPEGTIIDWQFKTIHTEKVDLNFLNSSKQFSVQQSDNQLFTFEKQVFKSEKYTINLNNQFSDNKEKILYNIDVIPDQFPQISLNIFQDTTLYNFIALGGNVADDYGLSQLQLFYQIQSKETESPSNFRTVNIPISRGQNSQSFYYQWELDSLGLEEGNEVKYYLKVWDNDGVNGRKASKTGTYTFRIPSKKEIKAQIEKSTSDTQEKIDKTLDDAKELREKIDEAEKRLKGKKDLNWQDESLMKDILKKREQLNEAIEKLKQQNKDNSLKRDRFSEQDERLQEKVEQLQELMDELLDEETKKLYEELQKLLEDQMDFDDAQNLLEKLSNKEDNLEKELERTLELFKRMKFDYELNESINELKEQAEKQEELSEKTEDRGEEKEELVDEQEQLQEDFKEFQESMEELNKLNEELKNPENLPETGENEEQIEQEQQNSKEQLQQNKRKKSSESQNKASEQMKKMAQQLEQMQNSMEMSMMSENLDHLRDILHNLLKLSFDQENLMNEFREVKQSDPRFVELAQKQLKLKDDAKIVEDSLLSLSKRVFQIASFITREVGEMNDHMDGSVEAIRERKKPLAVSEQQFAMTSINNLALLLDDVFQQMQQQMADAMGKPQKGGEKKPMPGLSELQQQLNQKIQQLKQSGKSGRALSEELAKLAAEQERIRKQLEEMEKKLQNENGGQNPASGIPEKMEDTEKDLVNKQITEETIKRQKEILTRLLEAEKAVRELLFLLLY